MRTLKSMKAQAIQLYTKLEDWTLYTHKTEMNALEDLTQLFRQAIEKEEKI